VTVASSPGRRAGLKFVEKLLTTNLTSTDTTERNAGMLRRVPHPSHRLIDLPTGWSSSSSWSSPPSAVPRLLDNRGAVTFSRQVEGCAAGPFSGALWERIGGPTVGAPWRTPIWSSTLGSGGPWTEAR
jgi:hypothetical protein